MVAASDPLWQYFASRREGLETHSRPCDGGAPRGEIPGEQYEEMRVDLQGR